MRVTVVGLGYVGSVTAACFAEKGHEVVGVDTSADKVTQVNSGLATVQEKGLGPLVRKHSANGRLRATTSLAEAWATTEVVIVSVGTPSAPNGDVELGAVRAVVDELGELLRATSEFRVIVITSTIPPGTLKGWIQPRLEALSGKIAGTDFGLCFSPEFLREGTAIDDFTNPEKVIIGSDDLQSTAILAELYLPFSRRPTVTSADVAETVKFASNSWHALKVSFANEIGRICSDVGVDSHEVMTLFKSDRKLNVSDRYLTPGFAFGGSCLPKDLRTLTYRARARGVSVPVLEAILPSNAEHLNFALREVERMQPRSILILGLAFKAGTDDLRESPAVPLAESLLGRGYRVQIFDQYIQTDKLIGANREYIEKRLPHLVNLLRPDLASGLKDVDLVVIAQANHAFASITKQLPAGIKVLDLTGVAASSRHLDCYRGLAW